MKFKFLPLILFFLGTSAFAQISFGIKGGLNVSNIEYNVRDANPEGSTGLYAGTFVNFQLPANFELQPEVLYSQEGIKNGSIDFVKVPVVLKWSFFDGINIHAGPQLAVVVDAEGGTNGLNQMGVDGVFGLGYETPGGFMITTRYNMGITSVIDRDFKVDSGMGYLITGFQGWTRNLQLGIGYKF